MVYEQGKTSLQYELKKSLLQPTSLSNKYGISQNVNI